MYDCEFCKKNFCKKFNLDRHLKSCKKEENITPFKCNLCLKSYSSKWYLEAHKCKSASSNKNKIETLEKQVKDLQEKLKKQKPTINNTIINNTTINNNQHINNLIMIGTEPLDLSQKRFDSIVDENYTYDIFKNGYKLVSNVILKFYSNNEGKVVAILADKERMKLKCLNLNGKVVTHDPDTIVRYCDESEPLKIKSSQYEEMNSYDVYGNKKEYIDEVSIRQRNIRKIPKYMKKTLKAHKHLFLSKTDTKEANITFVDNLENDS
jgi:hypothetical protein